MCNDDRGSIGINCISVYRTYKLLDVKMLFLFRNLYRRTARRLFRRVFPLRFQLHKFVKTLHILYYTHSHHPFPNDFIVLSHSLALYYTALTKRSERGKGVINRIYTTVCVSADGFPLWEEGY